MALRRESLREELLCGGKSAAEKSAPRRGLRVERSACGEERRGENIIVESTAPWSGERRGEQPTVLCPENGTSQSPTPTSLTNYWGLNFRPASYCLGRKSDTTMLAHDSS